MAPLDLSSILKPYEGQWVALSEDNKAVLGSGKTAKEALLNAEKKGSSDATLMFVQPSDFLYCGRCFRI